MANFDFPASPTVGQTYTLNGVTYTWDGQAWMGGPQVDTGLYQGKNATLDEVVSAAAGVLVKTVAGSGGNVDGVPFSSDAQYWQGVEGAPVEAGIWTSAAFVAVAYAATIALNPDNGINFVVAAPTGAMLIDNFTKGVVGRSGSIALTAPAADRALTFGNKWFFPSGQKPTSLLLGKSGLLNYLFSNVDGTCYATFDQSWTNA
jgi:hypothetical protein